MTSRARSTTQRLWAAALLCVAPLGLLWSATPRFAGAGTTLSGTCDSSGYCTPDVYVPGYFSPGTQLLVLQSPVRVFLIGAAAGLAWIASRSRTVATLRVARVAVGAIAITAVLAAANGVVLVLVCALGALWLAAPPVLRPRLPGAGGSRAR